MNIPDANFKLVLVSASSNLDYQIAYTADGIMVPIDANSDGEIQLSEAALITGLQLTGITGNGLGITDLTGIESFVNLKKLECSYNPLGILDIIIDSGIRSRPINSNISKSKQWYRYC